uniref:SAM_MT_ERG6_SMT domain-containing protein n=1 Tax=Panagrellus redivivus TaxID=6233 RepID=A0A7E4WAI2_PANRE
MAEKTFVKEHDELYREAKVSNDHATVTSHYYSVMSTVIDEYFNGNFHFVPPNRAGLKLDEALSDLHHRIGECLELSEGKTCIDIGCGIGGVINDLEGTGAEITGITIAPNEVEIGNTNFQKSGIYPRCQLVEGDCHKMPFPDASKDTAYAIYALKYFVNLTPILNEIARVLKPGGRFVIYDLVKTNKYDETNEEHRSIIEGFEYACGMPSIHYRDEMVEVAKNAGLKLVESVDLSEETGFPYYYCFTSSPTFMWLAQSPVIKGLIKVAQALHILPQGFHKFNETFLSGTVLKIVEGGKRGILAGSEILVFEKV